MAEFKTVAKVAQAVAAFQAPPIKAIIVDGDTVQFMPAFPPAIVVVQPGKIEGKGAATFSGKKVCVLGDETKVEVKNCAYNAPPFVAGQGTLKIFPFKNGDPNVAQKTKSGNKPFLLKGMTFKAQFQPTMKAKMPPPANTPDPTPIYFGFASFINSNAKFNGS